MDDADRAIDIEQARVERSLLSIKRELKHTPEDIECIECGEEISEDRRKAMPNCTRCFICQELYEKPRRVRRF